MNGTPQVVHCDRYILIYFSKPYVGLMARYGPRDFVMPAAAFTMAVTVIFYVRSSMRRAKFDAEMERQNRLEAFQQSQRRSPPAH